MFLPGRDMRWKDFLRELRRDWMRDKMPTFAGALAYAGVLALFPFLLFVVALAGLVIDPRQAAMLVEELNRVAPPPVASILGERITALTTGTQPALLTVSALGAVWAASGGLHALLKALNTAFNVEERRPIWKVRALEVVTTLGAAAFFITAAALAVAAPAVAGALGGPAAQALLWARIPLAGLLMLLVIATLYHVLPDRRGGRFRLFTTGSVVAVVVWIAASLGFSFYVSNFGQYEITYGALGGFIVLLLWMWISASAILLGAEINAIGERAMSGARAQAPAEERPGGAARSQGAETNGKLGAAAALGLGFLLGRGRRGR